MKDESIRRRSIVVPMDIDDRVIAKAKAERRTITNMIICLVDEALKNDEESNTKHA